MKKNSSRVYSTEHGRICPRCERAVSVCSCKKMAKGVFPGHHTQPKKADGFVRIQRETKGRKGAGVTIVSGLNDNINELKVLSKQLKKLCSSGGAIKAGKLEVQGDHRQKIKDWLEEQGHKVKLVGG